MRDLIFISFRSIDQGWAAAIDNHLSARFGKNRVFRSSRSLQVGRPFPQAINAALQRSCVTVVLISEKWLSITDTHGGRRLDDPQDFVRQEIASSLEAGIPVIPLLINQAKMPEGDELPADLRQLVLLQNITLRNRTEAADLDEIARRIANEVPQMRAVQLLGAVAGPPPDSSAAAAFPVPLSGPRLPGSLPAVFSVPFPRSPSFTGRDDLLVSLLRSLRDGGRVAVHALHGLGGVGKTSLAVEYAYRFAADYQLVWWVNAQQPALVGEQIAGLAVALHLVTPDADTPTAMAATRGYLGGHDRWLVIFDNVPTAADVAGSLPAGPGHVLITSRSPAWTNVAAPVPVDLFTPAESVAMLQILAPRLDETMAGRLAYALGNLPLALAQAVGVLTETGVSAAGYLDLLSTASEQVLSAGTPPGYPASLAASVQLALTNLTTADPAAGQLMRLCALFGPEPIPLWLFTTDAPMPSPLRETMGDAMRLGTTVAAAGRFGLVQAGSGTLTMHRLTQAVIRADHTDETVTRATADALLAVARPDDGNDPRWWPRWAQLLPHLLDADPATTDRELMQTTYSALWSLYARGDYPTALALAQELRSAWSRRLGVDDDLTIAATHVLASVYAATGRPGEALPLHQDSYDRRRRRHGADHRGTLISANNLAIALRALGRTAEARDVDQDAVARRRRVLGDDHPDTLGSAANLALDLLRLGQVEEALDLNQDTLARRRRVLGDDHPETLIVANNLAEVLREMGQVREALDLDQDTLARRRRVLGEDRLHTLSSATGLAADLRALGRVEEAADLDRETLARCRRVLGDDHPLTFAAASNLAADLRALRRACEAALIEGQFSRQAAGPAPTPNAQPNSTPGPSPPT